MVNFSEIPNNAASRWWKDPGMRRGMLHIFVLYTAVYSLGYDGSLLNGLQALPPWQADFGYPAGTRLGLLAASYYLPKIPAVFVLAWLVDKFGRKLLLYIGAVFMIGGAIAGGFANNMSQLIGSRILLGFGTVAGQMGATALVPELAHPRIRHFAGSYLLTTFYIGSIFASWLTFAMVYFPGGSSWSWRIPNLVQGLGPAMLMAGTYFLPESPRWLVKKGRAEEAHRILATYHANGDMNDELVLYEMKEIKAAIEIENLSKKTSWASFFTTAANRRRLIVLVLVGSATQLAGNGVVQYYLVPILRTVGITQAPQTAGINGGLAIWNWFVSLTGASLVERFGRRRLFLTSFCGMLASFILILGLSGGYDATRNSNTGIAMVPFIFVFMGFYSMALTPLPLLYIPEIVPLSLRAKAIALFTLTQNVSQTFNQFVNPVALTAIGWRYYAVYVAVLIFYLVSFFLMIRETKGLTVEEAAVVYESEDAKMAAMEAERILAEQAARAAEDTRLETNSLKKEGSVDHVERERAQDI